MGEFIALDDGHTEPESPEINISIAGAVRPPECGPRQKTHNSWPSEDSIGSEQETHSRVILVSKAHQSTAGEENACPLQHVDHGE